MKVKNCVICNKTFNVVTDRKTCSKKCYRKRRLVTRNAWYKRNAKRIYLRYLPYRKKHQIGRQYAERFIERLKIDKVCFNCKSDISVDVHHIDKNTSNNDPKNLQVLCRYCHVKAHKNPTSNLFPTVRDILLEKEYQGTRPTSL